MEKVRIVTSFCRKKECRINEKQFYPTPYYNNKKSQRGYISQHPLIE